MSNISFAPEMMRALIDGRKTQTRRIHKNGKPKFKIGDVVYVKEGLKKDPNLSIVLYEADGKAFREPDGLNEYWPWKIDKLAAMYCPKWASRYSIKITNIRQEKIKDISEADAKAEGFEDKWAFFDYFAKLNFEGQMETAFAAEVWVYDFEVLEGGNNDQ